MDRSYESVAHSINSNLFPSLWREIFQTQSWPGAAAQTCAKCRSFSSFGQKLCCWYASLWKFRRGGVRGKGRYIIFYLGLYFFSIKYYFSIYFRTLKLLLKTEHCFHLSLLRLSQLMILSVQAANAKKKW